MHTSINYPSILKAFDWAYEKALIGFPGLDSAQELALKYMGQQGSMHNKAKALIRKQSVLAGTSGFITGFGGFITLPVAIPANLASVLFIQIRMVAALAYMFGHDLQDHKVKTLVNICFVGNFAKDILQEAGIRLGTRLTAQVVKNISEKSLLAINKKIGFRLLTSFSGKGAINLGKAVPLVGAVIGGTIDTVTTSVIGKTAMKTFLPINA